MVISSCRVTDRVLEVGEVLGAEIDQVLLRLRQAVLGFRKLQVGLGDVKLGGRHLEIGQLLRGCLEVALCLV